MAPPSQVSGGVLPMPTAVLQRNANASHGPASRATAPRLKLVLRRLPPGLTQQEFEAALGEEWKTGEGKVDWMLYKPGKISTEYATPKCLQLLSIGSS